MDASANSVPEDGITRAFWAASSEFGRRSMTVLELNRGPELTGGSGYPDRNLTELTASRSPAGCASSSGLCPKIRPELELERCLAPDSLLGC
jgi:hypothetical protein